MQAAAYAELRARKLDLERKQAVRPARPGGSDGSLLVTRVRQWQPSERGAARSSAATEDGEADEAALRPTYYSE